jgi:heterogeneous nuclear ribonucleoprotein U
MPISLPGGGKSTWVERHLSSSATPTHVASTDVILERFAQEMDSTYAVMHATRFKDAEKEFKASIITAAQKNMDIIIDRTNLGRNARRKIVTLVENSTRAVYIRTAILFEVPDEVLKARIQERFERTGRNVPWGVVEEMKRQYDEPTSAEFHFIRRV